MNDDIVAQIEQCERLDLAADLESPALPTGPYRSHIVGAQSVDPLAKFADRDQAVRDRIATVLHRDATSPHFYAEHVDYLRDKVDALRAKQDLVLDMVCSVPYGSGVLRHVLEDAHVAALTEAMQWEDRLRASVESAQMRAYSTYRDNLRVAS
jgi:hypothetical protein